MSLGNDQQSLPGSFAALLFLNITFGIFFPKVTLIALSFSCHFLPTEESYDCLKSGHTDLFLKI